MLNLALSLSKEDVLRIVCPVKPVRTKDGLHCPVCPDFTSRAGEKTEVFEIQQVLIGRFAKGKTIAVATYSSKYFCEPGVYVGGHIVLEKEGNGYRFVYGRPRYLGFCKVLTGKDEDKLLCRGEICKLEADGLNCQPAGKK